jgi:hypothetical protein
MADTANFEWPLPTPGGSAGTWGVELNAVFDEIDTDLQAVKTTADGAMPKVGGVFTGEVEHTTTRNVVVNKGNMSGAQSLDLTAANVFYGTITGGTTISFTGWTSAKAEFVVLELTNGGSASIAWPSGVRWDGGTAPTLRVTGVDVLVFYSRDNGTTIRGALSISSPS